MIAQGVDILIFPPRESQALAPSVMKAKAAGIPVILIDRDVDHAIAKPGEDYVTFIGSDFVDQGRRAAEWLVEATGGKAKIIELEGTTGADPAIDRKTGFDEYLLGSFRGTPTAEGAYPEMEIIASQTGDFQRDTGRQVMQTLLQAHPDVTAVYAHNDEMAIGAIAALEEAGRKPGEDVILVSIDGENAALDAILDGTLGASVESSPFFGPIAFETMQQVHRRRGYPRLGQGRRPLLRQEQRRGVPGQAVLGHLSPDRLVRLDRMRAAMWPARRSVRQDALQALAVDGARQRMSLAETSSRSPNRFWSWRASTRPSPAWSRWTRRRCASRRAKCTPSSARTAPARAR